MALASMSRRRCPFERPTNLVERQPRRRRRVGRLAQQFQRVGRVEISSNASSAAGKYLAQRVPQPLGVAGPFPDQRLVHAGNNFDPFRVGTVDGDRPQLVGVGAHHVGQDVRVGRVALGAGDAVPFPGTGPPATGSPRTRYNPPRPTRPPTGRGRFRSRPPPRARRRPRRAARRSMRCSRAIPATPSGSLALASLRPAESISSTS